MCDFKNLQVVGSIHDIESYSGIYNQLYTSGFLIRYTRPHFSHWNSSWTFLNSTHRTSSRHHNTSLSSSTNSYLTLLLNILWWFKIEYNFIVPYRYCTSSLSNWYHIHPYRSSILLFQGSPWNIYTRYIIYIYHHSAHLFFNTILLFVLWSHHY